jgi:uncharacterized protein (TIGR03083 family)
MSEIALKAFAADRDEVLNVARSLSDDEWQLASDCEGWRVQDVIVHMADVCRAVVDPGALPPGVEGDIEASQSARVDARRDWSHDRVLAEYEDMSGKALQALEGLQTAGVAENVIPLDNLGSYPMHMIANAFAFDHFCHLRNDILRPNGPIDRPVPPVDDVRMRATLEWLMAGLPQMAPDAMRKAVTKPIGLRLSGPGGGEWTVTPSQGEGFVGVSEGVAEDAAAVVSSSGAEFVVWATRRRPWRERDVQVTGDEAYAQTVLDAIHVF